MVKNYIHLIWLLQFSLQNLKLIIFHWNRIEIINVIYTWPVVHTHFIFTKVLSVDRAFDRLFYLNNISQMENGSRHGRFQDTFSIWKDSWMVKLHFKIDFWLFITFCNIEALTYCIFLSTNILQIFKTAKSNFGYHCECKITSLPIEALI